MAELPGWSDYTARIGEAGDLLALLADPADPALVQEAQRLLFLSLSAGYFSAFADPDLPDFVPAVNTILNASSTNPDFIYGATPIDGSGVYRMSGQRGDGRFAIERIDQPLAPRRLSPEQVAERLMALAGYPKRYAGLWLGFMKGQRAKGLYNAFEHDDWAGRGGVQGQHYYQGLFRLEPGHALILETALPDKVRYWNVQLADPVWNTIDWMNRQSSLNGGQARIDSDERFRAVIALEDPGVPNWLDPGGWSEGAIMLRWTEASSGPAPTLRSVPVAAIRAELPQDTPIIAADDRQLQLRARRRGVQLRRRW